MTTELKRLKIDRVDLVPEGANSAAFITLYKGKELNPMELSEILEKMKPEHSAVIQAELDALTKAKAEVEKERDEAVEAKAALEKERDEAIKAKEQTEEAMKACTKKEGTTSFDEDEQLAKSLEGIDPAVREYIDRINKQKSAAEEVAKAALAKEKRAEAEAKAESLKALPVEKSKLVDFIETASTETVDMLSAIAKGVESTVLTEVGKSHTEQSFSASSSDAWNKIETEAASIAKARGITKEAAVSVVLSEQPALYKEYLEGGAN